MTSHEIGSPRWGYFVVVATVTQADGLGWHRDATLWRRLSPTRLIDFVRRGATRECVETTSHIVLAADGVAMVPSSLRDEMVGA